MATELGLDEMFTFLSEGEQYETHSTTNTPDGWWCLLLYRDHNAGGVQKALLFQGDQLIYPP